MGYVGIQSPVYDDSRCILVTSRTDHELLWLLHFYPLVLLSLLPIVFFTMHGFYALAAGRTASIQCQGKRTC